ncbi:MAG: DEAD/DEAH box helicase [Labilithrix sp.]|nr:DEAD/DEAH box helicase [Labilithrix sp.]
MKTSAQFDLGLDTSRMRGDDAERQHATVAALVERFWTNKKSRRRSVQILADEVGMGKTFVALATAYSVLQHMREAAGRSGDALDDDLRDCYQKVVIITPHNSALFRKWKREAQEFVRRCIKPAYREDASSWFAPADVERIDDLSSELRRTSKRVLVTHMGVFSGAKLRHYDVKRRFVLGLLFRVWSNALRKDARENLLKGAPADWPRNPDSLRLFSDRERELLGMTDDEGRAALDVALRSEAGSALGSKLLERCRELGTPYRRSRDEDFGAVERLLIDLYKHMSVACIRQAFPLVIVDEAHNWKNGPSSGSNGYDAFREWIAPHARRALLLTATPFQLSPTELLELLRIGQDLEPCPTQKDSRERTESLRDTREKTVRPVLRNAENHSRKFARAWGRLPAAAAHGIGALWESADLTNARADLRERALRDGVVDSQVVEGIVGKATAATDPMLRELIAEALRLYAYNTDLSQELGEYVIRHRRRTEHRLFRIGVEYVEDASSSLPVRSDRHMLHAAPGVDVRGDGELPHYLLMRCVSEMKGRGRSSLGSALTGCYSTLNESAEGKEIKKKLASSSIGALYLDLLGKMAGKEQDPSHPKVHAVVERTVRAWNAGEKTLIFCFRTNTAQRLFDILSERLQKELAKRREECLGGARQLEALKARVQRRDGDLLPIVLDRVLWSGYWALPRDERVKIDPSVFALRDEELAEMARLALRYRVDVGDEKPDRVFIHRATEHILARRLLKEGAAAPLFRVLDAVADESWVAHAYGLTDAERQGGEEEGEAAFDEKGVQVRYPEEGTPLDDVADNAIQALASELVERRARARAGGTLSIFDIYASGPSLWLGPNPTDVESASPLASLLGTMHVHLNEITRSGPGGLAFDWKSRALLFKGLRSIMLRDAIFVRLLPSRAERDEAGWGELLVERFFRAMPGQTETMAHRVAVYLEDIRGASGTLHEIGTMRHALYDATRSRNQGFVALVKGGGDDGTRERTFTGFNTPLTPEVLICTSVGQEGIDLHRHCRNVVHYDLAWNPAVIEQRTGRVDRIGSKTARERDAAPPGVERDACVLDVGVPFLAGTYDERMYEELRLRAQTFEVLTGGDVSADNAEGADDVAAADGSSSGVQWSPLPARVIADLRVNLHVWAAPVLGSGQN